MGRTKKVGFTGRYGARYGKKLRDMLLKAGDKKKHDCPSCMKKSLRREAAGVWVCKSCGHKLAGKAYKPA